MKDLIKRDMRFFFSALNDKREFKGSEAKGCVVVVVVVVVTACWHESRRAIRKKTRNQVDCQ